MKKKQQRLPQPGFKFFSLLLVMIWALVTPMSSPPALALGSTPKNLSMPCTADENPLDNSICWDVPGYPSLAEYQALQIAAVPASSQLAPERLDLTLNIGKSEYRLTLDEIPQSSIDLFDGMSPENRAHFLEKREIILKKFAQVMHTVRFALGVGSLVGDHVMMLKNVFRKTSSSISSRHQNPSLSQRSRKILYAMLKSIDQQLWSQAPLVERYNEMNFFVAAGAIVEGKTGKGWGGALDLGISIGYNTDTKALVFQIFENNERYKDSLMPGFVAVIANVKGGVTIANLDPLQPPISRKGSSFYPPVLPGFKSNTADSFSSGLSSGFGFPPIGSDLLTYTNELEQKVLVRISISPVMKGFVRMKLGMSKSVPQLVNWIRSFFASGLCSKVYVN